MLRYKSWLDSQLWFYLGLMALSAQVDRSLHVVPDGPGDDVSEWRPRRHRRRK